MSRKGSTPAKPSKPARSATPTTSGEARVHVSKAVEKLESAAMLLDKGFIDDAVSRAYYAVFHAVVATLRFKQIKLEEHKHVFILNKFRTEFIDPGTFPEDIFFKIQQIKQVREQADYSAMVVIGKEKAQQMLVDARQIVELLKKFFDNSQDGK